MALEVLDTVDLHPASVVTFRHVDDYFVVLHTEFLQEKERKFRLTN